MSMISLLLHRVRGKAEESVNNKVTKQCNLAYFPKTVPINASFVKQQAMASDYFHLSKLDVLIIYAFHFMAF